MSPVSVIRGDGPVILGFPHSATWLPEPIAARLTPEGARLIDTDWHVPRLYAGLLPGATEVHATFHRYLIDANRDPAGRSLYPGQATTELCPTTDFDGRPLWQEGGEPTAQEIAARRDAYHAPYHAALAAELARVRAAHGVAILYDCHSIRSQVPRLFEGTLPDLNLGTADGASASPALVDAAFAIAEAAPFSAVRDGRFKGGWTTRHHGRPQDGVHAIQMELSQASHLETEAPPFAFAEAKAARLRPVLAEILAALAALAPRLA